MNKIGDKLRFKAMGDITDFHCIAEKYLTDLIIKTNGIVTIREITKYGDYHIKECELDYLYEKDMFSGLVEDTAPSTEREVWINKSGCVMLSIGGLVYCHARMNKEGEYECQNNCAAFAIKDGCAICKMMHGDQIIGKLIRGRNEQRPQCAV